MNDQNPYQASFPATSANEEAVAHRAGVSVPDFSEDTRGNLGLISRVIKAAAVFAAIASTIGVLQIWAMIQITRGTSAWTTMHTLACLRLVFTPCFLLLAWMMWRYARCLDDARVNGISEIEATIEQQTKMWLSVGLLIFLMMAQYVAVFAASFSAGVSGRFSP